MVIKNHKKELLGNHITRNFNVGGQEGYVMVFSSNLD